MRDLVCALLALITFFGGIGYITDSLDKLFNRS